MALSEAQQAEYDAKAKEASKKLEPIVAKYPDAFKELGQWWQENLGAGHKRLGRLIVTQA